MTIVNNKMERKKIVSSIKTNIILLYFYYLIKKMWQSPLKTSQQNLKCLGIKKFTKSIISSISLIFKIHNSANFHIEQKSQQCH
jgi:hypothetical protein